MTMVAGYLDRLARSAHFDSWRTDELSDALAAIDDALGDRSPPPDGGPGVLNIRFQIYRQRLQRELDHRAAATDR
ncbi:hypothetical protein [Kribbella soli]|uniref:Uncharacterized protein n=1 Tax=Kribbella soli TaxID=1124743 RepID=A0A4R0HA63_9ACTN|nr:hypothetical protein [Kribbella soli]TCC07787.1 hypothetical protein E0H45_17705 [Kribbella soli]